MRIQLLYRKNEYQAYYEEPVTLQNQFDLNVWVFVLDFILLDLGFDFLFSVFVFDVLDFLLKLNIN